MKILVTGSEGVVGSCLVEELKRRNHEVHTLDIKENNTDQHFEVDIGSYQQLSKVFENNKYDFVYNLAASFGRKRGEDRYDNLWYSNAVGTKNVIRMQEKYDFKLIHFSSSEVYGDFNGMMTEDVMEKYPIRQMNDYAMTKNVNEMQILNSADQFDTKTVRVRLFNLYGKEPYSEYRSVICKFIYKALHNQGYTVYLDYLRTSCYIDDAVLAIANIVDNFKAGEVYNIGGTELHDIKTASDIILRVIGQDDTDVLYETFDRLTTKKKHIECTKAMRDLQLNPKIKLEEGIALTVDWMKQYYHIKE